MLTWETEAWGGAEAEPGASLGASPAGENRAGARPVGQALPCVAPGRGLIPHCCGEGLGPTPHLQ